MATMSCNAGLSFYYDFLTNDLNILLEEVPLDLILRMWFMHDGAPPHFPLAARAILHQRFPNKWIGRHNVEILRQRIEQGCQQVRETPGIWERLRQSMMQRSEACITAHGSHFEHLL